MVYQGYMLIVLVQMLDGRVPGDKIDDEVYDDEDSTNSKMWQGSLPHKKTTNIRARVEIAINV